MENGYRKTFEVRWADLDANRHMRNTAYADCGTHVRFSFLNESGFTPAIFEEHGFGPVIFREETQYLKEVVLGETITVDIQLAGLAPDGTRWRMQHNVLKASGETAAILRLEGAWMDLRRRKLTQPPEEITRVLRALPRTPDFEELRSVVKKSGEGA